MKSLFHGAFLRGASTKVLSGMLAISLAACAAVPQPLNRPGDVPEAFTAPSDKTAPIWPQADWWGKFGASELPGLQATAQKENLDIAQAAARILQAEARDGIAVSALFPTLNGSFGASRSGANLPSRTSGLRAQNAFTAGLNASYQQGLFGTQYFDLQSAREDLRFARYFAAATGITTAENVASVYFSVLSFRERIAVANANIAAAKRILAITQAKVNSGVASNLDLAQEQAIVAQQESTLPGLIESEKEARYSLAILLGKAPEGFDVNAQNLDGIEAPAIQPGLPPSFCCAIPASPRPKPTFMRPMPM